MLPSGLNVTRPGAGARAPRGGSPSSAPRRRPTTARRFGRRSKSLDREGRRVGAERERCRAPVQLERDPTDDVEVRWCRSADDPALPPSVFRRAGHRERSGRPGSWRTTATGDPVPAVNGRSRRWLPDRSHTTTSRFRSVVYAVAPSGESAGPRSGRSPVSASVVRTDAVATSQIRSRESFPTVTTERPSGVKAAPTASYKVLYGP